MSTYIMNITAHEVPQTMRLENSEKRNVVFWDKIVHQVYLPARFTAIISSTFPWRIPAAVKSSSTILDGKIIVHVKSENNL